MGVLQTQDATERGRGRRRGNEKGRTIGVGFGHTLLRGGRHGPRGRGGEAEEVRELFHEGHSNERGDHQGRGKDRSDQSVNKRTVLYRTVPRGCGGVVVCLPIEYEV